MSIETLKAVEQDLLDSVNDENREVILEDLTEIADTIEIELMGLGFNKHTCLLVKFLHGYIDSLIGKIEKE